MRTSECAIGCASVTSSIPPHPHILIVGTGSAGRRHASNLAALGCRISCVDLRSDRMAALAHEIPLRGSFSSVDAALAGLSDLDGLVIATPTAHHRAAFAAASHAGLPVLLEKPVACTALDARSMLDEASRKGARVLLGYTWRWWPSVRRVRELLSQEVVGQLRHVQFYMSAHLADWHPWERYQDFFMASAAQGGGALLDESHWLDLLIWLFGMPSTVTAHVEQISTLEIDCDDNVDIIARYTNGLRVYVHLDLFGRPHEKYIRFVGDRGTLLWSSNPDRIAIGRHQDPSWEVKTFSFDRNHMFMEAAREYIGVAQHDLPPSCTLEDGLRVLELVEAARESSRKQVTVILDE